MKILIGVNTLNNINQVVYANHCNFWYRLGRERLQDSFFFFTPPRMSIDRMRNEAAKIAMKEEFDYLVFIDDDVAVPTIKCFDYLLHPDWDITAGLTVIRGYPYNYMTFKYTDESKTHLDFWNDFNTHEDKIIECGAVGFSCAAIKVSLLLKMSPPFFMTGLYHTEDIYFCVKALKEVPDVKIGFNPACKTAHIGDLKVFTPENRELHKKFDEAEMDMFKIPHPAKKTIDRGDDYLTACLQNIDT